MKIKAYVPSIDMNPKRCTRYVDWFGNGRLYPDDYNVYSTEQKPAKVQRVGFRVGATLRQQKKVYGSSNTNTNSASHRRSPIAHIRRGHFQGFWTGPRDSKKRNLVVKWVAPTYVRGQQGADTTTVFTVK